MHLHQSTPDPSPALCAVYRDIILAAQGYYSNDIKRLVVIARWDKMSGIIPDDQKFSGYPRRPKRAKIDSGVEHSQDGDGASVRVDHGGEPAVVVGRHRLGAGAQEVAPRPERGRPVHRHHAHEPQPVLPDHALALG